MQHTIKRILSLALAVIMLLCYAPVSVRAEGTAPAVPTATIGEAELEKAVFAVNFKTDALTDEQLAYYGNWEVDFVLTANKPLTMNNLKPSEMAYISLLCPAMEGFEIWSDLPGDPENDLVLAANEPWGVINYFAELMEAVGEEPVVIDLATFSYVSELCGLSYALILQESYLQANPGLVANVSLVLTNPETNETVTVATHTYTSPYQAPALPSATVTTTPASQLDKDIPLTFAKNFSADAPTAEQINFYGDWYADFVLKVNTDVTLNAEGNADGYLAGEYGEYGWIKVPTSPLTLQAGESLKIMEYAAKTMGEPGLQFTYAEVVQNVQSFNCGAYFTPEFLAANPDFEVTLELCIYETKTATEGKTIGETFVFTAEDALAPELPTAIVTDTLQSELDEGMVLTFAKTFTAIAPSNEQAAHFGSYYADFVLTVNKDVTLKAGDENADGYLSGQYDAWSKNWMNVPINEVTLRAGEELRIMEYAALLLNQPGLKMTYNEIVTEVGTFNCGAYFTPEFLAANPDFEVSLELRLYDPADENKTYTVGETYRFAAADVPALPTASVTGISNKNMSFAQNFRIDEITAAQMAYYRDWYADFELTINKDITLDANGTGDGYLSGQYDEWSKNWVNVPFNKTVTLEANETIKIMEFAAEMLDEPGLKYTYKEVYEVVKDFDCGVFFTPEFLEANPDLEVTLELRMYNPADETNSYVIGDTYIFTVPQLPTATITETENEELTFSMSFTADEITEQQLTYFGDWYADFELTINKDITLDANGTGDGYLSGQYDAWSENWVNVPFDETVTLNANETIKIMEFAAELLGEPGLKYTYREVYEVVKNFNCGVFFTPEFLAANPDLEVTLELRMYNPADETNSYVIGETYEFKNEFVAQNTVTKKLYNDVQTAILEAQEGDTIILLQDVEETAVYVLAGVTLDLNGRTLTTGYMACFGDIIDNSEDNAGLLKVDSSCILIQKHNAQLPVKDGEGYRFVDILKFNTKMEEETKFVFQPLFEEDAHALLLTGQEATGVSVMVRVSWTQTQGTRNQDFAYNDSFVKDFINSYNAKEAGKYGKQLTLTLNGANSIENLTFTVVVRSNTGVEFTSAQ